MQHEVLDEISLELGRRVAARLREEPALLQLARDNLVRWLDRNAHPFIALASRLTSVPAHSTFAIRPMIAQKALSDSNPTPTFRVGDERLIKVTPSAAKKVSTLLQRQGRPTGVLRVAVVGGGCSGLQYKMDLQDQPANRDFLVESGGIKVVVDPKSALYVTGSELDYIDALQDGGFKVKNPNAASSCSCGESFSA
jgi:iron-sulfur cluster assembly accessory protein